MSLFGFYMKFVRDFSQIAHPITTLQRKGKKFIWSEKCQIITTPILRVPNPEGHFVVINDASREGLGGILMLEDQGIAYESRKLRTMSIIMHHMT